MSSPSSAALQAIAFCGPSGVGKGALLGRLMQAHSDHFAHSISHTTRAPRPGEQNGREYHFVDRPTIERLSSEGGFLELCDVHGNLYGTSFAAINTVEESGKLCILEIDIQGARKIRENNDKLNILYIFIKPQSMEVLRERIKRRGAENEDVIERRLRTAESELQFCKEYPDFFHHIILNDDLDQAYEEIINTLNTEFEKRGMQIIGSEKRG